MKVVVPIRVSFLVFSLAVCSVFAFAQSEDWHYSSRGAKTFFTRSAFAHGYMHGYEEGFHNGDLDLQMGRPFKEVKCQEKFKKPYGYRSEFGDRGSFEVGYRKGYSVGYIDSYSGRSFRAMQLVREAKSEPLNYGGAMSDHAFDKAFMSGYEAGQHFGLKDGRAETKAAALNSMVCGGVPENAKEQTPEYCAAYQRGYQLGYSDGYANQSQAGQVVARK